MCMTLRFPIRPTNCCKLYTGVLIILLCYNKVMLYYVYYIIRVLHSFFTYEKIIMKGHCLTAVVWNGRNLLLIYTYIFYTPYMRIRIPITSDVVTLYSFVMITQIIGINKYYYNSLVIKRNSPHNLYLIEHE